jgi:SAM-dependent methyltransferase
VRPADRLFSDADLAALYDALCPREERADFDFYLPMVMSAAAVLDVGCGTGAMLKEARERGHRGRLCGLDPAPGMLAQARERSDIEWVLGDLASVAWNGAFELVVMTGHAFQVLVGDDEVRAALAAIRTALAADGRFAFETRNPLARAWEDWKPENAVEVRDMRGATVRMTRQIVTPFDGNVVTFTHTFASPGWDQREVSRSTLRFLGVDALSSFLAEAGLAIVDQFGSWDRRALTNASPEIITIARRG